MPHTQIETLSTENQNVSDLSTTKLTLNVELIKKILTEKKTTLPFLRNQDWKQLETENVNY